MKPVQRRWFVGPCRTHSRRIHLWKWFYDRDITGIPREGIPLVLNSKFTALIFARTQTDREFDVGLEFWNANVTYTARCACGVARILVLNFHENHCSRSTARVRRTRSPTGFLIPFAASKLSNDKGKEERHSRSRSAGLVTIQTIHAYAQSNRRNTPTLPFLIVDFELTYFLYYLLYYNITSIIL